MQGSKVLNRIEHSVNTQVNSLMNTWENNRTLHAEEEKCVNYRVAIEQLFYQNNNRYSELKIKK